jgi:hypothetical protein
MRIGAQVVFPRTQAPGGLAQCKLLARRVMALVNAKRLGLRWPSTAFPKDVSPPTSFRGKTRYNLWQSFGVKRDAD